MTLKKVEEVLTAYQARFKTMGVAPRRFPIHKRKPRKREALAHAAWLVKRGIALITEKRKEKAMRWLCFAQGVLWDRGLSNIYELKEHNRPR